MQTTIVIDINDYLSESEKQDLMNFALFIFALFII
jgi:hypothetical protein